MILEADVKSKLEESLGNQENLARIRQNAVAQTCRGFLRIVTAMGIIAIIGAGCLSLCWILGRIVARMSPAVFELMIPGGLMSVSPGEPFDSVYVGAFVMIGFMMVVMFCYMAGERKGG